MYMSHTGQSFFIPKVEKISLFSFSSDVSVPVKLLSWFQRPQVNSERREAQIKSLWLELLFESVFPSPGIWVILEYKSFSHTSKEQVLAMQEFLILGYTTHFFEGKEISMLNTLSHYKE